MGRESLIVLIAVLIVLALAGVLLALRANKKKKDNEKEEQKRKEEEDAIRAEDVEDLAAALKKVFKSVQAPKIERDDQSPSAPLFDAQRVVIVPGEGMVAAQAQLQAHQLALWLKKRGAQVQFALHPEAGHEAGKLRALLEEMDVDNDLLVDMEPMLAPLDSAEEASEEIAEEAAEEATEEAVEDATEDAADEPPKKLSHEEFMQCDVCIVIGANDIINPAANTAEEGSALFGKRIINVEAAKHLILCNFNTKPGLSGAENPLYKRTMGITLLMGDAKESLQTLLDGFTPV